ncbi:toxic anion resistance protein [Mesobaculum littorinae]|uniref:Toxic anion resistance protein n=1 Tax=Mesobaculum littorinae TaxID=2486419 RepID=A0A438AIK5_9RHOB|nr:toxic anion resistance protein [Mesobaculum littorinae]RVV98593.1 toxic anion resistance protein [Mesobaculum littorinae]
MSDTTRAKAEETGALVDEIASVDLPEPQAEPAPYDPAAAQAPEIERRIAELDLSDIGTVMYFGAGAQDELQKISQSMLGDVRNKDIGPAGDSLRQIVTTLRGFSVSELDMRRTRSWWERITGQMAPIQRFSARFETVQGQIDHITDNLLEHEHRLLKDIKALEKLYERTLEFYDELGLYIAAGVEKLRRVDAEDIPAKAAEVDAAPEAEQVLRAQELRDLRAARDDLDRRVHDLRLTRQVTMQALPSIRLVQENDKALVTKINSTLVNTVPLWETQLAQGLTIQRSAEAADAVREATDLTNELLTSNAQNLREANRTVREEVERGAFDIETVRQANAELIDTIEESLAIADEGRETRAAAEADLEQMERDLREALSAAHTRSGPAAAAGRSVPRR